jgi:hypothetical protein
VVAVEEEVVWEVGLPAVLQVVPLVVLQRVVDPVDSRPADLLEDLVGQEGVRLDQRDRHQVLTDPVVALPPVCRGGSFLVEFLDPPLVDIVGGVGGESGRLLPMVLATVPRTLPSVRRAGSVGRSAGVFPNESTFVGLVGAC